MENNPEQPKIEVGKETLDNLNATRKWTMFLAIAGFIFLGLIIVLGLMTGAFLTAFNSTGKAQVLPDSVLLAGFIGLTIIYFFPVLFLFRFSKHASNAVTNLDSREFFKAVRYLKRYFAYIGILLILIIAAYIAGAVLAGTIIAFLKGL
jgi:hypothetical protein